MLPLLATLSPNVALFLVTLAIALIAVELNRPGWILPGSAGVLLLLLAAASLWQRQPNVIAVATSIMSIAGLLIQTRRPFHISVIAALTILLVDSFAHLYPRSSAEAISPAVAMVCGTLLATGTTLLTCMARRARQNKGLD